MMITAEVLREQWNGISYKDGGFLQVDVEHPLEWHIGYQSASQKTLLLVSRIEIGTVESSKSMAVRRGVRADNCWTLAFELLRDEQQDVFLILCSDIIEYSKTAGDEKTSLASVVRRYKQWIRLLESQGSGLMDEAKRKGLIGELLFLKNRLDMGEDPLDSVQGWVGADGADQDFVYADSWYEIKSLGVSAASVTISSLEQLDCSNAGELVVFRIDKTAPEKTDAFSLNEIVYRIKRMLAEDADAAGIFQSKLTAYGYMDLQEYSEQKYYCSGSHCYRVDDTFPRLSQKGVPQQIVSLHYELSLPALAGWRKE